MDQAKKRSFSFSSIALLFLILVLLFFGALTLKKIAELKSTANRTKEDLKTTALVFMSGDAQEAEACVGLLNEDVNALRSALGKRFWQDTARIPVVGKELDSASVLVECADFANQRLLQPAASLLQEYPLSSLFAEGSVNEEGIHAYLELGCALPPLLSELADRMEGVELRFADRNGKIGYAISLFQTFEEPFAQLCEQCLPPVVALLKEAPLSALKTEEGFNFPALTKYAELGCELVPKLYVFTEEWEEDISDISFSDGALSEALLQGLALGKLALMETEKLLPEISAFLSSASGADFFTEEGINLALIAQTATLIEKLIPDMDAFLEDFFQLELDALDPSGRIYACAEEIGGLYEQAKAAAKYIPLLNAFAGEGEDRFYLLVAQNSAEIRAAGGFPGAVGSIEIVDGVLKIEDFLNPNSYFWPKIGREKGYTYEEKLFFGADLTYTWDAEYIPHFPRVAAIWSAAFEEMSYFPPDGIISLTPSIIQDLLKLFGDVQLTDELTLNGENATKMLQHDIYATVYARGENVNSKSADSLFADTVEKTMERIVEHFKTAGKKEQLSDLLALLDIFQSHVEDRTVMLWFYEEEEQRICEQLGCDGGLNRDPEKPEAGIYFTGIIPSKLGWWLDIEPSFSKKSVNDDGSATYDVHVLFRNNFTYEELPSLSRYIYGADHGIYHANIQLFAPAGGTISEFRCEPEVLFRYGEYNGIPLVYLSYSLRPRGEFALDYQLTTAPGVDAPLGLSMTPTLQKYAVTPPEQGN